MTLCRGAFSQLVVGIFCIAACRDSQPRQGRDSVRASDRSPAVTGLITGSGWDSTAGPFMVIPASRDSTDAALILPGLTDSSLASTTHFELGALTNTSLDLFNLQGLIGSSVLNVVSQSVDPSGCPNWPRGRLVNSIPGGWRVGLEKGRATGIRLRSMEGMQGGDSARFIGEVLNIVNARFADDGAAFHGIPFFVRKAYRLETPALYVIVAEIVRRINEEANPREEHLLLLAERRTGEKDYHVAFHTRSAGAEESLETSDVLAGFTLVKSNRPAVAVTFDYEDGGKIGLLERISENEWKLVWKSAYSGC
jgi:hypothetical protein